MKKGRSGSAVDAFNEAVLKFVEAHDEMFSEIDDFLGHRDFFGTSAQAMAIECSARSLQKAYLAAAREAARPSLPVSALSNRLQKISEIAGRVNERLVAIGSDYKIG